MTRAAILLAIIVVTAPVSCPAQEAPTESNKPIGPWAFTFALNDLSFHSFDGATLSVRKQTSDHAAWRYGISLSASREDYKDEASNGVPPSVNARTTDGLRCALPSSCT